MSKQSNKKAEEFLKVAHLFKLGTLPTEMPHPETGKLSYFAQNNLKKGYETLKKIDISVFDVMKKQIPLLEKMSRDMQNTIEKGNRVFLSGCGATGRLSLSIEYFWRTINPGKKDSVIGFMAGGDNALIKSIERFEDQPELAYRQMHDLGFRSGDMMVAITEGGETPFVIGTVNKALEISSNNHYFLYCNPDESLMNIQRSKEVIQNPEITKINLYCGPMALSGSTRMQATTIQMAAAGAALVCPVLGKTIEEEINSMQAAVRNTDYTCIAELTQAEADIYRNDDFILYETNEYGITIMTDSTERSPTFSLTPFENRLTKKPIPSLCYICLPETENTYEAWEKLLGRLPRPLNWDNDAEISSETLHGFDYSQSIRKFRKKLVEPHKLHIFRVWKNGDKMTFRLNDLEFGFDVSGLSILAEHTLLKVIMNTHSTLLMGILGFYKDNLMIWVRPSNKKLIDRCIRYIRILLEKRNIGLSYEDTAYHLFAQIEGTRDDEPIVLKTYERIINEFSTKDQKEGTV